MFCPQCNAQYRPGYYRCADCGVDLVHDPPHFALAGKPPVEPGDPNEDPFCSFWRGQDARVLAELCELLDEASIPHKTIYRADHLFNLNNVPTYEVGIPFSLFGKAEKLIEETYGTADMDDIGAQELAGQVVERAEKPRSLPENVAISREDLPGPPTGTEGTDWYPEDATDAVWSTDSSESSDFLIAALHENGINCRIEQQGTHTKLFVLPHNAARAREILREIAEGQPPE